MGKVWGYIVINSAKVLLAISKESLSLKILHDFSKLYFKSVILKLMLVIAKSALKVFTVSCEYQSKLYC